MRRWVFSVAAAVALAALLLQGHAAAEARFRDGAYEVAYRLDLPHLESREEKVRTVCIRGVGSGAPFPVLSANNPLAQCPSTNLRREGDGVRFEVACPGGGAAKAFASFSLSEDRFQGSIVMTMGGKNMTMTETQRGRRIGDCADRGEASRMR